MAVTPRATGLLENLEITGGRAGPNSSGGGIYSQGVLTLSHASLMGNTAGAGGATLIVSDSTIAGSSTRPAGRGSIENFGGSLILSFATETAGYNLSTDSSCGLSKSTDLTGVTPMLKPWRTMAARR
jgi:hypothetical protein